MQRQENYLMFSDCWILMIGKILIVSSRRYIHHQSYEDILDMEIDITVDTFDYKLHDVIHSRSSELHSHIDIPSNMFYSKLTAEILRTCRATAQHDFLSMVEPFMDRKSKQGARGDGVKKALPPTKETFHTLFESLDTKGETFLQDTVNCHL